MRTDFVNMEAGDKKKLGRGNNEVKGTLCHGNQLREEFQKKKLQTKIMSSQDVMKLMMESLVCRAIVM